MAFKVTDNLQQVFPVKETIKVQPLNSTIKYISAEDVTPDMLNSISGIDSKYLYISRICEITGKVSSPTLKVIGDKPLHR